MERIGREIYMGDYWKYDMDDIMYCATQDCYYGSKDHSISSFAHHNVSYNFYSEGGYDEMLSMYLQGKSPELRHYKMEDVVSKYSLDVSKFGEHEYREEVLSILPEEWRFVQVYVKHPSCIGNHSGYLRVDKGIIDEEFHDNTWVLYNSNIFSISLPCESCSLCEYQLYFFTLNWDVIIDNELYMPIAQDNRPLWGIEYMFTCSHWQDLFNNMDIYFKNVSAFCKSADYRFKTEGFFCNKVLSDKGSLERAIKYLKSVGFPLTDIDYRDFTSCIFEEGYLFESYICSNVDNGLDYCFRGCYMWDGFLLPQDFCVFKSHFDNFDKLFRGTRLPKRLTERGITNESSLEEIISSLKRLNVSTKEEVMEALKLLVQQGKSIEEAKNIVVNWGANSEVSDILSDSMLGMFKSKCSEFVDKLLIVKNGKSRYTIGEVRRLLISRGYPRDLVERCIVDYLEDEYLV